MHGNADRGVLCRSEDCSDLEAVSIGLVDRSLGPGTAEVTLTYTGKFNPNRGIYRSEKRTDNQGNTKLMIASQFETRGARHAFPCIDEPAQKVPGLPNLSLSPC